MLLLQCIICGTDNGRGEGFNDFLYRNKFVIYIRILEGNEKPEARLCRRVFSPLSGAHVNGLLMSPYVLYRFAFKFSYCVYMYICYCMACTFRIAIIIVRLDTPSVDRTLRTVFNCCVPAWFFFFSKRFVNIFILLR